MSVLCAECEQELTKEEVAFPTDRGYGNICEDCDIQNHQWLCDWCENFEDEDYDPAVFAVLNAEDAGIEAGLYLILTYPFYRQALIGGGEIFPECVEWIAMLPEDRHEPDAYPPCTFLCQACAGEYITECSL